MKNVTVTVDLELEIPDEVESDFITLDLPMETIKINDQGTIHVVKLNGYTTQHVEEHAS
jgi:hypothetical protein